MAYLQGDTHIDARRRRGRLNVGRVLVLNGPPAEPPGGDGGGRADGNGGKEEVGPVYA